MADKGKGKLKLLLIMQYLQENSDETHPVSTEELTEMLLEHGIECERKSIYSDIQTLRDFGLQVQRVKSPANGYQLLTRTFEVPELRLLMDAVQAASFISPDKTEEMLGKIGTLCSREHAKALRAQIGEIHKSRGGVRTLAVSLACRYLHAPSTVASIADCESVSVLVRLAAEKIAGGELNR